MLSNPPFLGGVERYDFHDVGLDYHHGSFYPPTPFISHLGVFFSRRRPWRSRWFEILPIAVTGWRQIIEINALQQGTPLPLDLEVPWRHQRFLGVLAGRSC